MSIDNFKRAKQFTRKDLGIDEDMGVNHNLDFLDLRPPLNSRRLPDESSNSSSQASSTVINPMHRSESKQLRENLSALAVETLDTDKIYQEKISESKQQDNNSSEEMNQIQSQLDDQIDAYYDMSESVHMPRSGDDTINDFEDDDDEENDYIDGMFPSPPSSPPRELDPNKLYALYDFSGPDPSHLELHKDDSVELLNDSDSYWWLVRKIENLEVGFAPAEILETFGERLARLNCWKNEVIERDDVEYLSTDDIKVFEMNLQNRYSTSNLQMTDLNYENSNVSVENTTANSAEAINPAKDSETSLLLRRKSSLKRSKSSIRKTVSFAPEAGGLPGLNEDDDGRSEVFSEAHDDNEQILISKRVSNSNFLVKNLDDYNERFASFSDDDEGNQTDENDDEYGEQGLFVEHVGIHRSSDSPRFVQSGIVQPPSAKFMETDGEGSIGSYSPSTISDSEFIKPEETEDEQEIPTYRESDQGEDITSQEEANTTLGSDPSNSILQTPTSYKIQAVNPGSGGKLISGEYQPRSFQESRNHFLEKRQTSSSSIKMLDALLSGNAEFDNEVDENDIPTVIPESYYDGIDVKDDKMTVNEVKYNLQAVDADEAEEDDEDEDEGAMNNQRDHSLVSTSSTMSSISNSVTASNATGQKERNSIFKSTASSSLETTAESLVSNTPGAATLLSMKKVTPLKDSADVVPLNPKLRRKKSIDNSTSNVRDGPVSSTASVQTETTPLPGSVIKRESSSSLMAMDNIHPVTNEIFNPLYSQLDELEKMLNEIVLN